MSESLTDRMVGAARRELTMRLERLCHEIGAAESSLMVPEGGRALAFFASTNAALMRPDAPRAPIGSSFSGIAFRTGQMMAVADASGNAQHYEAIDATTGEKTREFAAIPVVAGEVFGVLTLFNRSQPSAASQPFTLDELRRADEAAREIGAALAIFPGLTLAAQGAVPTSLAADIPRLTDSERHVAGALIRALIENRGR